jgi:excisionase family DNA binding protein
MSAEQSRDPAESLQAIKQLDAVNAMLQAAETPAQITALKQNLATQIDGLKSLLAPVPSRRKTDPHTSVDKPSQRSKSKNSQSSPPQLSLRIPGVAAALNVSVRTAQRLVAEKQIRSFKLGRARLVALTSIRQFLEEHSA